jgi:transcriptional regulator with XRE-family HTH domain
MSEEKVPTNTLLQRLFKTTSIDRFIRRYDEDMSHFPSFKKYINDLCTDKGVTAESIIKKADIERTYGHQLFNGTRKPSRDKVLQLAFGFEAGYEETQKLLSVARKSALHPKVKRDAAIIFALEKGLDIIAVQSTLFELGIPILGKERFYE